MGPRDISTVDGDDLASLIDLGGLRVRGVAGVELQVQANQESGAISQLSLTCQGSAVQVQPYAAPKSPGMWDDVRSTISRSVASTGGLVEEVDGPFGPELHTVMKAADGTMQPARFVGVEGPRWFVRAVFIGAAARDAQAAAPLEEAFSQIVVVRGDHALPKGAALPLRMPAEAS